jgi:glucan-binding YG repeat protein
MVLTAVVLSNLSVATYAAEKQRFCIDILPISSKNARYYSGGFEVDFNSKNYLTSETKIVNILRESMLKRETKLTIKYATTKSFDPQVFLNIFNAWFEKAYAETENACGGDYLRLNYSGYATDTMKAWLEDDKWHYTIPFNIKYYATKKQEDAVTKKVDEIVKGFKFTSKTSDKEKCDAIYDYITKNVKYDNKNLHNEDYTLKFSTYAALINKTAVCQGYASLFYRLARECGLEARVITGESHSENHVWNIVKIGKYYYYVDATWDAGLIDYNYYLKGKNDFTGHTANKEYTTTTFKNEYPIAKNAYIEGADDNFCEIGHEYKLTSRIDDRMIYTCSVCGDEKEESTLNPLGYIMQASDGKWYHYIDDVKQNDTTLVKYNDKWYYVKNGEWQNKATTLFKYDGKWYHIKNGLKTTETTIVKYGDKWYYVEKGIKKSATTLAKYNGSWYYVKSGVKNTATTLVEYNGDWCYVEKGKWNTKANLLYKYNGKYHLIKNGKWNSKAHELFKKGSKYYYVEDGIWNSKANVLFQSGGTTYYIEKGLWASSATTLAKAGGKWYYIKKGKWTKSTTLVTYKGSKYYVKKGYAQMSFSGKVKIGSKTYKIKKGKVVK